MALRVSQPLPLRTLGITSSVVGFAAVEATGVAGPFALIGFVLLCLGFALFDAVDRGRLELRHLGIFLASVGAGAGSWALLVLGLLRLLEQPPGREVYALLIVSAASVVAGVGLLGRGRTARRRRA
jgi:hypothetical protein